MFFNYKFQSQFQLPTISHKPLFEECPTSRGPPCSKIHANSLFCHINFTRRKKESKKVAKKRKKKKKRSSLWAIDNACKLGANGYGQDFKNHKS